MLYAGATCRACLGHNNAITLRDKLPNPEFQGWYQWRDEV